MTGWEYWVRAVPLTPEARRIFTEHHLEDRMSVGEIIRELEMWRTALETAEACRAREEAKHKKLVREAREALDRARENKVMAIGLALADVREAEKRVAELEQALLEARQQSAEEEAAAIEALEEELSARAVPGTETGDTSESDDTLSADEVFGG